MIKIIKNFFPLIAFLSILTGCASKVVNPISKEHNISHICIENNPKVIVSDFLPVMEDEFYNHGISSEVFYLDNMPKSCNVRVNYVAFQTWDLKTYLTRAEIRVYKDKKRIGYGMFNEDGGFASLSLNKWKSVHEKMKPIFDELLKEYSIKDKKELTK
jgi:hypothetical protein